MSSKNKPIYYNLALFEERGEAKLPAFEPGEKARTCAGTKGKIPG